VRRAVDRESAPGQFILTVSATPADDHTRHTGAGRFMRQRMRTLSWWEHDPGFGAVSLSGLFEGERPAGEGKRRGRRRLCLRAELLETVRYRLANPQPGVKVSLDEL